MAPNDKLAAILDSPIQPVKESPPLPPVWQPKTAAIPDLDDDQLRRFISSIADDGIFVAETIGGEAPFTEIGFLLNLLHAQPDLGRRLNVSYQRNLVFKDQSKGDDGVDQKRVFDLSEERMKIIHEADPQILKDLGPAFTAIKGFFRGLDGSTHRILRALAHVTGDGRLYKERDSYRTNWRCIDYHERSIGAVAPRCGEHRDFGPLTIIFPDSPGLQVHRNGEWHDIPKPATGALVLFGICTAWRSNDRIEAPKHRVDPSLSARRLSAVLFIGPRNDDYLAPILTDNDRVARWRSGAVGDVRNFVARKWRHREGCTSQEEAAEEEALKKFLPNQDAAIEHFYKIHD